MQGCVMTEETEKFEDELVLTRRCLSTEIHKVSAYSTLRHFGQPRIAERGTEDTGSNLRTADPNSFSVKRARRYCFIMVSIGV